MKTAFIVAICFGVVTTVWGFDTDWDHFVYAQTWPPGTCASAHREHHTCHIGLDVKSWTIHGLWPSKGSTHGPYSCNNTLKFDFTKIASLKARLNTYWPNLYNDTATDSFWEHEWTKHGTCCQDLPATKGEFNFFSKALDLNRKYDIFKMLTAHGVVPSDTAQYSLNDFYNAIKAEVGYAPLIQCEATRLENGTEFHLVGAVEICLNKDFTPCEFPEEYHRHVYSAPQSNCPTHYNFNYPPIRSNRNKDDNNSDVIGRRFVVAN